MNDESAALNQRLSQTLNGHIQQLIKHAIFMSELAASARKSQSPQLDAFLELRSQAKTVVDQAQRAREVYETSSGDMSSLKRSANHGAASASQSSERSSKRQRLSGGGTAGPAPISLEQRYDEYQTEVLQRLEKLEQLRAQRHKQHLEDAPAEESPGDQGVEAVRSQMSTLAHDSGDVNGMASLNGASRQGDDKQKKFKRKRSRESGGEAHKASTKKSRAEQA